MNDFGFKDITRDNWAELDPVNGMFGSRVHPDEIVEAVMAIDLSVEIPDDVRKLFAVARGTMCYGCLFYPLWTLGAEQLFRIVETAVRDVSRELGMTAKRASFESRIKFIHVAAPHRVTGIDWRGLWYLRCEGSHPTQQTIVPPTMAMGALLNVARVIHQLFEVEAG